VSTSALPTIGIVVFFVIVIVVVLIVTIRHARGQRVSVHDGQLLVATGIGSEKAVPTADIGTVLYIPENDFGDARYKHGVFDYGGLLFLNKAGKLIRIIQHYAGSSLPLRPIFEQVPADQHVDFSGKQRKDLVKAYPHSVGFWQMRTSVFWVMLPVAIFAALIVLVPVVAFLVILVIEITQSL
jgi:hypothetical protein